MAATNPGETKRMGFNFSKGTYEALEELAKAKGGSLSDALSDAIALSKWFKEQQDKGAKILIEENGKIHELLRL